MSCPYLGGDGDFDICEVSGRKLSVVKANGFCESGNYVICPNYITIDDDEEDDDLPDW